MSLDKLGQGFSMNGPLCILVPGLVMRYNVRHVAEPKVLHMLGVDDVCPIAAAPSSRPEMDADFADFRALRWLTITVTQHCATAPQLRGKAKLAT